MHRTGLAVLGTLLLAAPAAAETRTFVIANTPDGYGVDHCLATGAACGRLIATAFCQARDYPKAASFRRVDHVEVTGTATTQQASRESGDLVAIECAR